MELVCIILDLDVLILLTLDQGPDHDELKSSLLQYAKEQLPLVTRIERLKEHHSLIIGYVSTYQ